MFHEHYIPWKIIFDIDVIEFRILQVLNAWSIVKALSAGLIKSNLEVTLHLQLMQLHVFL